MEAPRVSVVIPTLRRPRLLLRALDSVFRQTCERIEVIVVVDGPDEETVAVLRSITDPRLKMVVNAKSLTAAGARNVGVEHAMGAWIAFLDDDDEWLPDKLERQLALAAERGGPALVTCLSQVVTPIATYVWPAAIYDNSRPLDEYLFDRRTIFAGSSFIQTSSYLLPRLLFEKVRFRTDTPHDDWDFLLRLSKQFGARIETVPEVLVRLYFEERRPSLSHVGSWAASLAWLDDNAAMMTRRGYSGFCLCVVGPRAARERAYAAFFPLLLRAFANGAPRLRHVLAFVAFWIIPQDLRRRLRALFRGRSAS
jgi:glycosyltransferase involved in cell wall biosynthesis